MHYARLRRHGHPEEKLTLFRATREEETRAFVKLVEKTPTCWLWTGDQNEHGYGWFRRQYAHRFSYTVLVGKIPDGLCVLHRCDVPRCVNPDHLFLGTRADNNRDKIAKGRQARGERTAHAKLSAEAVTEIRRLIRAGEMNQIQAARQYGVDPSSVSLIMSGKNWRHICAESALGAA